MLIFVFVFCFLHLKLEVVSESARAKIGQFLVRQGEVIGGGPASAVIEIDWVGRMGHPHPSSQQKNGL